MRLLDDEAAELLSVDLRKRDKHVGECGVGDPHLFAVEHPVRAISTSDRIRFRGQCVGTSARFRKRVRRNLFCFAEKGKVGALLFFRTEIDDWQRTDSRMPS